MNNLLSWPLNPDQWMVLAQRNALLERLIRERTLRSFSIIKREVVPLLGEYAASLEAARDSITNRAGREALDSLDSMAQTLSDVYALIERFQALLMPSPGELSGALQLETASVPETSGKSGG